MAGAAPMVEERRVSLSRRAGRWVLIAISILFLGAAADRAARRGAGAGPCQGSRGIPAQLRGSRHAFGDQAHAAHGGDRRADQHDLRHLRGLGDREIRVSRQEPADHADRPAVRRVAGDRGPDPGPRLRRAGLVRLVAGGERPRDHLRAAGHRARHDVRDVPLRGARADPADAAAGQRGGGGRDHAGGRRAGPRSCASRCRRSSGR